MLVVGPEHTYSSYGGLVAGLNNNVTGANTSVSGGWDNNASKAYSSVSGGRNREASGPDDWRANTLFEDN